MVGCELPAIMTAEFRNAVVLVEHDRRVEDLLQHLVLDVLRSHDVEDNQPSVNALQTLQIRADVVRLLQDLFVDLLRSVRSEESQIPLKDLANTNGSVLGVAY